MPHRRPSSSPVSLPNPTPRPRRSCLALVRACLAMALPLGCAAKPDATVEPLPSPAPASAPAAAEAGAQALRVCPGTDAELQGVLSGLELDHAVMDEATGLADASHRTRAVEGLGERFPVLWSQGWRALLATPVATRVGQAPDRLLVAGTRTDAVFEPFAAPPGPGFEAVLGCAAEGGYEVLALHRDRIGAETTLQFFGVDVVPSGDGGAVTFVHLLAALPELMEFGLYSTGWGVGPGGQGAARVGEPIRYGEQVIFAGQHARSEPLVGSGWYPIDGDPTRWRMVVLLGVSGPGEEEGQWVERVTLQPRRSLEAGRLGEDEGAESWMWLGRGERPPACDTTLRCTSLRDPQGGYFPWRDDAPPFDWIAGVWTEHAPALAALEQAGVDLRGGAWLLDSASWYAHFDQEQGEGRPLPAEAEVRTVLPLRPGEGT